jgi:hypothetical protein
VKETSDVHGGGAKRDRKWTKESVVYEEEIHSLRRVVYGIEKMVVNEANISGIVYEVNSSVWNLSSLVSGMASSSTSTVYLHCDRR